MAITSIGYPTDIGKTNVDWASIQNTLGRLYFTGGGNSLLVKPKSNGTRQVTIGVGRFGGCGIYDYNDTEATVALPTVSSGTKYFMVVARRNWNSGSVGTTFAVIDAGTNNATLPERNADGGVAGGSGIDDQPLALVPLTAGNTVPGTPIDLRARCQLGTIFDANSELVLQYMQSVGVQVCVNDDVTWTRLSSGWTPDREVVRSGGGSNPLNLQAGTGFTATSAGLVSKGSRAGHLRQLLIVLHKGGNSVTFGPSGGVASGDRTMATVGNIQWQPKADVPGVTFEYISDNNATYVGYARYTTQGNLIIISGAPNTTIKGSSGSDWSVRAQISFIEE